MSFFYIFFAFLSKNYVDLCYNTYEECEIYDISFAILHYEHMHIWKYPIFYESLFVLVLYTPIPIPHSSIFCFDILSISHIGIPMVFAFEKN